MAHEYSIKNGLIVETVPVLGATATVYLTPTATGLVSSRTTAQMYTEIVPSNLKTERIEMGVSSTTTITTGAKGRKQIPYNGTIQSWVLISDVNTTTTVDIWKSNGAIPTVANTITASAKPALSSAQLATSSTLTGWGTGITAGDVVIINVDSNSAATYLYLELVILKT